MFCVNQGYLKATRLVTGAMVTPLLVHTHVSIRRGPPQMEEEALVASLGRLQEEGRWWRVKGGFLPPPPSPLDLFHLTPSEPPGGGPWPAPDLALSGDGGAPL